MVIIIYVNDISMLEAKMSQNIEIKNEKGRIFPVVMSDDMKERLRKLSEKNHVSMAQIVKTAVDDYLRARKLE